MIKVSIVIVSWNVVDLLVQCISQFYRKTGVEIVVVDNNSSDGTVERLRAEFPEITLIPNKENMGFARGNNQGFEECRGEYIYILNPDTFSTYDDLMKLVQCLDRSRQVGGVGPRILYANRTIQKSSARKFPSIASYLFINTLRFHLIPLVGSSVVKYLKYPYDYDSSGPIECCSGAAYMVRGSTLKSVGGFSNRFLHTGEDAELMWRIRRHGYQNYYCAESELIHYAGESSKQAVLRVSVNTYLSTFHYFKVTRGVSTAILFWILLVIVDRPVNILLSLVKLLLGKNHWRDLVNQLLITRHVLARKKV